MGVQESETRRTELVQGALAVVEKAKEAGRDLDDGLRHQLVGKGQKLFAGKSLRRLASVLLDGLAHGGELQDVLVTDFVLPAINDIRQGKFFEIALDPSVSEADARDAVERIAKDVLANPVIEDYRVEISQ